MPVQRIELKRKSIAFETIMNGYISTDAVRRDDNARQVNSADYRFEYCRH